MRMPRGGWLGLMALLAIGCEPKSPQLREAEAQLALDSAADASAARRERAEFAAESRADSIGGERMKDVLASIEEPPPSTPVGTTAGFENTPEFKEAMQYAGQGPSFDCRKTLAPWEQAVCGDPVVSALERAVSVRTAAAIKAKRTLRPDDRGWRTVQLPVCAGAADPTVCLRDAMVDRLRAIGH